MNERLADLESALNSFNLEMRLGALQGLIRKVEAGEITCAPPNQAFNMHCHTFFSYNAYGHSPASLVWLAKKSGWALVGMVDFDVLDGVDEFLKAGDLASVRTTAGIETRVYIPEFSTREINSPGEPGVAYHMGIGFTSSHAPKSVAPILKDFRYRLSHRNQMVIARVNAHLSPLTIDYAQDVLPLSPADTPTERHIVLAYVQAATRQQADPVSFWSNKLDLPAEKIQSLLSNQAEFQNLVRIRLMKRGGPGYIQPTPETFPSIEDFHKLILACNALPTFAWLDGTSPGEQAIDELLDLMITKGVVAVNIIPDRNWNLSNPEIRQVKVAHFNHFVSLARQMDLPINVGTEMNSPGNKLVDEFDNAVLAPFHELFLDGAYFVYGHTMLQRAAGLGRLSPWAQSYFDTRSECNAFYIQAGKYIYPGTKTLQAMRNLSSELSPREILQKLSRL